MATQTKISTIAAVKAAREEGFRISRTHDHGWLTFAPRDTDRRVWRSEDQDDLVQYLAAEIRWRLLAELYDTVGTP